MPYDISTRIKPSWANWYDRECDVSDAWMEVADPKNEFGELCTAYFLSDRFSSCGELRLEGVSVEDRGVPRFYDRAFVLNVFGESRVAYLENLEMEAQGNEDHANGYYYD